MSYELHYRDQGNDVRRLQEFLIASHSATLSPDGLFGPNTRSALIQFQTGSGLEPTGFVEQNTREALERQGLVLLGAPTAASQPGIAWPPRPAEPPQPGAAMSTSLFGKFAFRHAPTASHPAQIEILDDWVQRNIVSLHIPQLDKAMFAAGNRYVRREAGIVRCHRLAAGPLLKLFARWEEAGLMDRVLTCAGAFNARLRHGETVAKPGNLSNHAWGSAIDLNAAENPIGHVPPGVGARGSVRELVGIANDLGFFWGGHYASRPDGMHFELAQLA